MPFFYLFSFPRTYVQMYFSIATISRPLELFPFTPRKTAFPLPRKTIFSPSRMIRSGFFTLMPSIKISPSAAASAALLRDTEKAADTRLSRRRDATLSVTSRRSPGRKMSPLTGDPGQFQRRSPRLAVIHQYKIRYFL